MKHTLWILLGLVLLLCSGTSAMALTATGTFTVSASVAASCSVSGSNMSFGGYDPTSASPLDATSTISVSCTNGTAYSVGLNAGTGSGASIATGRKMTNSGNTLTYNLYRDSGRTTIWGQTAGTDTASGTGNGSAQPLTVYGRVANGQNVAAGSSYTDTITVTVTF